MAEFFIILALVLLALWVLRKIYRTGAEQPAQMAPADALPGQTHAFEAVSIHAYGGHCDAAAHLSGHRFLSSEAPPLPLPDCTGANCHCVYLHHYDRRTGSDRRVKPSNELDFLVSNGYRNRRTTGGRRASDLAAA